ncbi:MAG TPA: archaemetzincin family Zn-dependent metalloprotease [Methanothrix sp.]|nr:archaemetzincin family Zn-dependent metalloprotease [Methanothrix sp.]
MTTIILQPVGAVDQNAVAFLDCELGSVFGAVQVRPAIDVPAKARVPERGQLEGGSVLAALPGPEAGEGDAVLGVIDEDIFVAETNFIFGLACGSRAIISLARLRQEFYGLSPDPELFRERAKKEAIHELGHVFGLSHCTDKRCVMAFSNSIGETDFKSSRFCERCRAACWAPGWWGASENMAP